MKQKMTVAILVLIFSCSKKEVPIPVPSEEEYEIYAILIDSVYYGKYSIVYIADKTRKDGLHEYFAKTENFITNYFSHSAFNFHFSQIKKYFKGPELTEIRYALNDYFEKNHQAYPLQMKFKLKQQNILIDSKSNLFKHYRYIFEQSDNNSVIIELSRVGFNSNHDCAFLIFSSREGWRGKLCYVYLQNINKKWVVKSIFGCIQSEV